MRVTGNDVPHPGRLQHQDDREPDRPAPDDDRGVPGAHPTAAYGVQRDRHRLGQRRSVGFEPVGHTHRHRGGDEHLLGVPARRLLAQPGQVHRTAGAQDRQRDEAGADRPQRLGARAVVGDRADELVTHHDPLVGAHEPVVPERGHVARGLVAVQPGVQVGPADPAPLDVEQHLALRRRDVGDVLDLELAFVTGDRAHEAERTTSANQVASRMRATPARATGW
jgi:hypothetical protein